MERELCASMLRENIEHRKLEAAWERKPMPEPAPQAPTFQLRFRIGRTGNARFLSHLESMSAWIRALRRCKVPLAYSQGFHPHPKIAFSSAVPVGEESLGEYMDVQFTSAVDANELAKQLDATSPEGLTVLDVTEVKVNAPSLMGINHGGVYKLAFPREDVAQLREKLQALADAESVWVDRKGKTRKGRRRGRRRLKVVNKVDIRPMIQELRLEEVGSTPTVHATLVTVDGKPGKPAEVVRLLADDPAMARIVKIDTLRSEGTGWASISADWGTPAIG
jgi:radical SAM-linked protein